MQCDVLKRVLLCLALALTQSLDAAPVATVQDIRVWAGPDATRVVLDLSAPVEHSVMTLQNPDRVVLIQRACAGDPNLLLENLGEGRFRVRLAEPDYVGKDCLAVDEPGTEPGLLFAAWSCDDVPRQVFSLEPVGDGLFRIALPAGGMCVDVLARDVAAGAQFDTEPCAEDVPSQQFQFIP